MRLGYGASCNRETFPCAQKATRGRLERCYGCSRPSSRQLQLVGAGAGFTFEASPFCSYASRNNVHVLFAGEVSKWPGIDAVSLAHNGTIVYPFPSCVSRRFLLSHE